MKNIMLLLHSFFRVLYIELERQIDHNWRRLTGLPTLKRSTITPDLFLGGQYSALGLLKLQERGITAIVNMRTSQKSVPDLGQVSYLHLPTPDHQAPTLEQLLKGIAFIKRELEKEGKVYIHCAYGEGRGPTMMIAYLISTGLTMEAALEQVQKVRRFAKPTSAQMARLSELATLLGKNQTPPVGGA